MVYAWSPDGVVSLSGEFYASIAEADNKVSRYQVRAVPTEVVAEQFRAGESTETIADLFDLTVARVEQALRFELSLARTA